MRTRSLILSVLCQAALSSQQLPVFRVDVDLATVACVVTDARGVAIRGLEPGDFRIYDGTVRQEIRGVWVDGQLPLVVGLIIDESVSQRALVSRHQATVESFLRRIIRPGDRGFVVTAGRDVVLRSEFLGGPNGLRPVVLPRGGTLLGPPCPVLRGRSLCGGTALWNAVFAAASVKLRKYPGSKALVILSDGDDTGSTRTLEEAAEELRRSGGLVYAVPYPSPYPGGRRSLAWLAQQTGGAVFSPAGDEADSVLRQVESDLRSRYVLGFRPDTAVAPGLRRIRVEVTRPGLMVRVAPLPTEP
jgi:VWFA-related protein